jgi:voltage-gated potassium channel
MHGIKTRLKVFLLAFLVIMIFGTIGFEIIEGKSLVDSAYFVIVTMATVGYGDIHPATGAGKIFTVVLIIMGVGTFVGLIANATETMLAKREIESRMENLNMVIGVFYSEVGLRLLGDCSRYDGGFDAIRPGLIVNANWTDKDFSRARDESLRHAYAVDPSRVDFVGLKSFLIEKRDFLVRLLENPVLLEHQSFTDLLRAAFHLMEELSYRDGFEDVPNVDRMHLAGDIKRVYHPLVGEWISYMKYLRNNYPFLFSLALRTNPFDAKASVIVT